MNRVRAGFLLTRNPFNAHQVKRVSLAPADVDVFVFWTRNPEKLIEFLPELDEAGYRYYFQFTITGYPRALEKSVPNPHRAIQIFRDVSDHVGPDRMIWRYDPILVSNQVELEEHKRLFAKIAALVSGATNRVVISFADFYQKTERNLRNVDGLTYRDIVSEKATLMEFASRLSEIAINNGLEIASCSEAIDLDAAGIPHGKCIDDTLIEKVFGISVSASKDKNQREECGCVKSIDIGQYNTCLHGCSYCYATFSPRSVDTNRRKHDPGSPFLIGSTDNIDPDLLSPPEPAQGSLF